MRRLHCVHLDGIADVGTRAPQIGEVLQRVDPAARQAYRFNLDDVGVAIPAVGCLKGNPAITHPIRRIGRTGDIGVGAGVHRDGVARIGVAAAHISGVQRIGSRRGRADLGDERVGIGLVRL